MKFKMEGFEEYDKAITRLGQAYGPTCKSMLAAAVKIVSGKLKAANGIFAKHVKGQAAKHSRFGGWYAKVHFGGAKNSRSETRSGSNAGRAALVYEYGRAAGTYKDEDGDTRHYPAQPARPFIRRTIDEAAPEVIEAMQQVYDEEVAKIFR